MFFQNVIKFWLDKGVDGFRVDAIKHLFKTENMNQNESVAENSGVEDPFQYEYLNHTLTVNMPEIFEVVKSWRHILDQYTDRYSIEIKISIFKLTNNIIEVFFTFN